MCEIFIFIILFLIGKYYSNNNILFNNQENIINKLLDNKLLDDKIDQIDQTFYDISTYPELDNIYFNKDNIHKELKDILSKYKFSDNMWKDWPELELYNSTNTTWKIMPFFYYDYWIENNCTMMPSLTKFLKSLSNLKIALISVLSPHTRLNEHQGWGNHSNNVLRCHYGLVIPDLCFINVKNENDILGRTQYHEQDKWIIFDDSKTHFATNNSDYYRVVLIVDLIRPKNIKKGTSTIGDTKELLDIIKYIKENDKNKLTITTQNLEVSNQSDDQYKNLLNQNDLD